MLLPALQRTITPTRSRRSMLETLVRHLDMVRLTVAAAAILMMSACSGLIDDGGSGGISAAEAKARQIWIEKALPVLANNCASCHNGSRENIGFFVGDTDLAKRDAILAYEPLVLNVDAPSSSRLLTKGSHEGPALDAVGTSDLLEWANAEREAALDNPEDFPPRIETAQFIPQICTGGLPDNVDGTCPFNVVPLDTIGAAGASISFVVQALGSGLYVTNLKLIPGTDGAFIEHPLFVSYPADGSEPKADTIDRFFAVKMNLMVGAAVPEQIIGGGTAAFVGFLPSDKLSIHFKSVSAFVPEEMPPAVAGCKDLPSFKTNAQTRFTQVQTGLGQSCQSCHNGSNANATSAVDMTLINNADDAMLLIACNEIRTRVNFQTIAQSGIFLAPAPGNMNHPVRFAAQANADAFAAGINPWILAEQAAP
jgi:hypothetical protein